VKLGFQCVQAHSKTGFIAFRLARDARIAVLAVLV
jgi:hypothetical protein